MKQILSITLCFLLFGALPLRAEDTTGTLANTVSGVVVTPNAEVAAGKAKVVEEKTQIKDNSQAARAAEMNLHKQIFEAQKAGDTAKVQTLRAQLKTTHQQNAGQMKQDKTGLKTAKKELRTDRKVAVKGQKAAAAETTKAKKSGWWGQ